MASAAQLATSCFAGDCCKLGLATTIWDHLDAQRSAWLNLGSALTSQACPLCSPSHVFLLGHDSANAAAFMHCKHSASLHALSADHRPQIWLLDCIFKALTCLSATADCCQALATTGNETKYLRQALITAVCTSVDWAVAMSYSLQRDCSFRQAVRVGLWWPQIMIYSL